MNFIDQFVSEKITHALGWTVLHALWQVSLLALVMAIVLYFLKNKSAKLRYTVGCVTLFLMLGISQVTFLYQFLNYKPAAKINPTANLTDTHATSDDSLLLMISTKSNWKTDVIGYLNNHIELIVGFWIIGFLLFAIRLFGGLRYISKIRKTAQFSIDNKWKLIVENICARYPIQKSVQLAESAMVQVPIIIGYFKPLILFPIGTLNGLDQKEVEAILAHELGHIFRNDYLVNLLQSIVDVFFYFHPAAWWISSQIRIERENCCDDLAIEMTNCSLTYAKALVSIQESSITSPMLAMTIMKDDKKLLNRIRRILNQPTQNTFAMEKLITSCLLLFVIFGLTVSAAMPDKKTNHHESDAIILKELLPLPTLLDTLPPVDRGLISIFKGKNNTSTVQKKSADQDIKITMDDDEIVKLIIDGEKIDANDYHLHQTEIDEVLNNLPPPPPIPPTPSVPPIPPVPGVAPPTPPSPPVAPNVGGLSLESDVNVKWDKSNGKLFIEVDPTELENPIDISVVENEVFINGQKVDANDDLNQNEINGLKVMELIDILTVDAEINDLMELLSELDAAKIKGKFPESFQLESFNFDNSIDKNKYPNALNKINNEYRKWVQKLRQEGKYPEGLDELALVYSLELEQELEKLKLQAEAHTQSQEQTLEDFKTKTQWIRIQSDLNSQLFQSKLANELLKDGLIDSVRNFTFKLKGDKMKVNGKKYKGAIFEKYKQLYLDLNATNAEWKIDYSFRNNGAL